MKYIETDFPYFGVGAGFSLLSTIPSNHNAIVPKRAVTGSIPVSFGGYIDRHQFEVRYYLERFMPLVEHSFTVQQENGPKNLFFSTVNVYENTFGFLYGYRFPFCIGKKVIGFYPKVGVHALYPSKNAVGNQQQTQEFKDSNGETNLLYIEKLQFSEPFYEYHFLTAGLELETVLKGRVRVYLQSLYNYGISGNVEVEYEYWIKNENKEYQGTMPISFNNFNFSAGVRLAL